MVYLAVKFLDVKILLFERQQENAAEGAEGREQG
jgi:hypothetical protein